MPQTLHLSRFQFQDVNIRRVGSTTDGGTSLSGISDVIESDGGGYIQADFTNGYTRTKADGLAWRQVTDLGLSTPLDVVLDAERWFGPGITGHVAESTLVLTDGSEYTTSGDYQAAAAALRATTILITVASGALPLTAAILFGIKHATWGWRSYRIQSLSGSTAIIRPPLREAISTPTLLDFDHPRCRMRLAQQPSNPTTLGKFGTCAATFIEDMRIPT